MDILPPIGPLHTDVVVVGNGPSALALSFMLAGNRPYYNGAPLGNEFLAQRLVADMEVSIVDKELEPLCEGLEGRSNNPVALLFDHLFHPDADLGLDSPSVLDWKFEPQAEIPHAVLGKARTGGTWQKMDGTLQTISQNTWMELPKVPFKQWLSANKRNNQAPGEVMHGRATISDVKDYYTDYVRSQGLQRYFCDNYTVTSVQRIYHQRKNVVDSESGEVEPCCMNVRANHTHCWEVRGYKSVFDEITGEPVSRQDFCYLAPHVVLATGAYDIPNRLSIEGETRDCVTHSLGEFEKKLYSSRLNSQSDPVLVVGAGLSAADAILMAMESRVPVVHLFRRGPSDPSLIFSKLPKAMYPEYHRIHSLMKGKETSELYRPLARHNIIEILDNKALVSTKKKDTLATLDISFAGIMIGSRADLGFLPGEGRHLGVVPQWPIDSKHNVIDVDPYSYQSTHEPQLFAMGPLVGDSFVRFGIGGSLGIVNHLKTCRRKDTM